MVIIIYAIEKMVDEALADSVGAGQRLFHGVGVFVDYREQHPRLPIRRRRCFPLSITIKSLSCRLRPDAEKFAAAVRSNRPSI
jgi:hypothetical protein